MVHRAVYGGVFCAFTVSAVEPGLRSKTSVVAATLGAIGAKNADPRVDNPSGTTARWVEPWIFGFPGDSAVEYVQREGLSVASDAPMADLVARHAELRDGTYNLWRPDAHSCGFLCVCPQTIHPKSSSLLPE